jgi:hypothetical protein
MAQIVSDLNQSIQEISSFTGGIIAVRKLLSEDIVIIMKNSDIRKRLKKLKK